MVDVGGEFTEALEYWDEIILENLGPLYGDGEGRIDDAYRGEGGRRC